MQTYTQEQKKQYFKNLRTRWAESKQMAENDETAKALFREAGLQVSYASFYFVLQDMRRLGFDGLPYIDCKTFQGWKQSGFKVKKGEQSKIKGITWMGAITKDEDGNEEEDNYKFPKLYHLFHKSQVEAIK